MFDETTYRDVCQKIAIVDILYADILSQENEELSKKLSVFRAENVQWVLNQLHQTFQELDYVLELEESNHLDH
ncbi:MAG: hypothetical protein EBS53_03460 [Bacteroidetes bacterium]|nr:hypothetical protein [Bacteroidota bacterium]